MDLLYVLCSYVDWAVFVERVYFLSFAHWMYELNDLIYLSFGFPADIISTVEFNYSGELLATGDKGGRVVIFQREQEVTPHRFLLLRFILLPMKLSWC